MTERPSGGARFIAKQIYGYFNEISLQLITITSLLRRALSVLEGLGEYALRQRENDFPTSEVKSGHIKRTREIRPPLPDPEMVRRIIRLRQRRHRFLDGELFGDPAWDMLLDLTVARAEHARVSVSSLCIASGVAPTTALRWIGQMVEMGLFVRVSDDIDRRRVFITLSEAAAESMARYFADINFDYKYSI